MTEMEARNILTLIVPDEVSVEHYNFARGYVAAIDHLLVGMEATAKQLPLVKAIFNVNEEE